MDISVEQEIKRFFAKKKIQFDDASSSFQKLDFNLVDKNGLVSFNLDVKEKQQKYNTENWPRYASEPDLFILDDLTVRKCLAHAPKSGTLARDNIHKKYHFFSVIDLVLIPRKRVKRQIQRNQIGYKGKWLINLRNGKDADSIDIAASFIQDYLQELNLHLLKTRV